MEDVNISIYRASVVREGSTPASPGFVVSEGQNPVDPSGSGQNHLPVTITTAATGLSITDSQVLGGAGTVGQYIRGDGSLADFPESSGGGSSVSYYLNGSVAQGTIGGVAYKELNKVPVLGAGTDFTINADGYIASFITDAGDPNLLEIAGGNWNFETYFSASSNGGSPSFYVELYKVNSGGTATLIASNSTFPELIAFGTNVISYFSTLAVPTTALALTDRLAIRYYVIHSGRTITLHTEDNHLCQIITTFTTGITALNGLTAQVQNFAVGTSGTDFAISSATATHTFNLPTASATNRGALSSADWTTFNNKTSNLGTVTSVGLSSATSGVTIGSTPVTTSGTITLAIATASGSQNGLLSSTDWTTFNSKQNALTNPVTGTGTSGQVAYFTGTSAISSESNLFWDATNDRLGIGTNAPGARFEVKSTAESEIGGIRLMRTNAAQPMVVLHDQTGDGTISLYSGTTKTIQIDSAPSRPTYFNAGNLLIGTTTDNGARLQVSGTATVSGVVGIGNTSPKTFTGTTLGALQVGTSWVGTFAASSSFGTILGNNVYYNSDWKRTLAQPVSFIQFNEDNFYFANAATGAADSTFTPITRMAITSSGNVGIAVTNPAAELQVGKSSDVVIAMSNSSSVTSGARGSLSWYNSSVSTVALIRAAAVTDNVGTELQFYTRPVAGSLTQQFTITSSGNVGIGTTSPAQILDVRKPTASGDTQFNFVNSQNSSSGNTSITSSIYLGFFDDGGGLANVNKIVSGKSGDYTSAPTANSFLAFHTTSSNTTAERLRIAAGGAVTINNLGTGTVTATAGTLSTVSDLSYKIEDGFIDSAIEKVLSLKPRYFYWNEKSGLPQDIRQLGFYAQEVNEALGEEAANTPQNENTPWGISDRSIIAMLTRAIQELKQEIDTLKN